MRVLIDMNLPKIDGLEIVGNGRPDLVEPESLPHPGELWRCKNLQLKIRMGIHQSRIEIASRNRVDLRLHREKMCRVASTVLSVGDLCRRFTQPA